MKLEFGFSVELRLSGVPGVSWLQAMSQYGLSLLRRSGPTSGGVAGPPGGWAGAPSAAGSFDAAPANPDNPLAPFRPRPDQHMPYPEPIIRLGRDGRRLGLADWRDWATPPRRYPFSGEF